MPGLPTPLSTMFGSGRLSDHARTVGPRTSYFQPNENWNFYPVDYPFNDININPVINRDNFDLAKYFNDLYDKKFGALYEDFVKRVRQESLQLAQQQLSAGTWQPTPTMPFPPTDSAHPAKTSICGLADTRTGCVKLVAIQFINCLRNFILGTAAIHTFAGLVTFSILSLFNRDIMWFILYWLQVPVLGLNGPPIGWLYVPPKGHWENEVNTRRWRCTFYVFTDNNHWLNLLKRALLLYSVVYPVTYFFVPDEVIHHPFMTTLYNIRDLGLLLAAVSAIFWAVRNFGRRFLQSVQATWSHLRSQGGFLFGRVWRKRHLCCIGLVLFLAWWNYPSPRLPVDDPKNTCGAVSEHYSPGVFLSLAGLLYRLGDFVRAWASSCFL